MAPYSSSANDCSSHLSMPKPTECRRPRFAKLDGALLRNLGLGLALLVTVVLAASIVLRPSSSTRSGSSQLSNTQMAQLGQNNETLPVSFIMPTEPQPPQEEPPKELPSPNKTELFVSAWSGSPYGVAALDLVCPADRNLRVRPDEMLSLTESKQRILAVCFARAELSSGAKTRDPVEVENADRIAQLRAYFLFVGDEPLDLSLHGPKGLIGQIVAEPIENQTEHRTTLKAWWPCFEKPRFSNTSSHEIQDVAADILAARLRLARSSESLRPVSSQDSELEKQFERTLSTLLGIDSFLLACAPAEDVRLLHQTPARSPLPRRIAMASVPVPPHRPVAVDPLSLRTPVECYYLRCQSLDQFDWLSRFMTNWGGGLTEIVSTPSWNFNERRHLEQQLGITVETCREQGIEDLIDDMAILGTDLEFADGAGLGLLFETSQPDRVAALLQTQQNDASRGIAGVRRSTQTHRGVTIDGLVSPYNHIRSFIVRFDDAVLVTNSLRVAQRSIEASRGDQSLGKSAEFVYAKSKFPAGNLPKIHIYLSDPFFRQLASPEFFIERRRRARANREIATVVLAQQLLRDPNRRHISIEQLREQSLLPPQLGKRADAGAVEVTRNGRVVDQQRGARGFYKPIVDCDVHNSTRLESEQYRSFVSKYQRQWRRVDPISLRINSHELADGLTQVKMKIDVTPYARERYQYFSQYLAASRQRVTVPSDLLSISANVKTGEQRNYEFHLGIQDAKIPFEYRRGELVPLGDYADSSLWNRNQYALVDQDAERGFEVVEQFLAALENKRTTRNVSQPRSTNRGYWRFSPLGIAARTLSNVAETAMLLGANSVQQSNDDWTALGRSTWVREQALNNANLVHDLEHMVHFELSDISRSQVAPYIQAYAYLQTRRQSSELTQTLSFVDQLVGRSTEDTKRIAEEVVGGRPVCPLGGTLQATAGAAAQRWASTSWESESYYDLKSPPDSYRYPFLKWLRTMEVRFSLAQSTLSAAVTMTVDMNEDSSAASLEPTAVQQPMPVDHRFIALNDAPNVGDVVFVRAENATFRQPASDPRTLDAGTSLTVVSVKGNWVGVFHNQEGSSARGWVRMDELGRQRDKVDR